MRNLTLTLRLILVGLFLVLVMAPAVSADNGTNTTALRQAVTPQNIAVHMQELENAGPRVAGTPNYDFVARTYFEEELKAAGGGNYFNVYEQPFDFPYFEELSPAVLQQTAPGSAQYVYGTDFVTMEYSGSGDVTSAVQAVDLLLPPTGGSTSGCEASDFAGFVKGNIALIQRGTCTFAQKAANAETAGAAGVIIFNEGNDPGRVDLLNGTLGGPGINIPVVGATYQLGYDLNALIPGLMLHLKTDTRSQTRTTFNVIAETKTGRTDRVVVVGAHIDSVAEGPGVNDNGSGSSTMLEVALQMARLGIQPRNQVRFGFWSAEEEGLLGAAHYVSQLSPAGIKNTAVNLDFDMLASNNYVRFVYDGDGSSLGSAGPNGSGVVENVFGKYFQGQALPFEPTAFDGRSDYAPFTNVGIPAGGVFAGADGTKTAAEVKIYGGVADVPYDPYYHTAGDTMAHVNMEALDQMSDAVADSVLTFAMTTSAVNGTDKGKGTGQNNNEWLGPSLQK